MPANQPYNSNLRGNIPKTQNAIKPPKKGKKLNTRKGTRVDKKQSKMINSLQKQVFKLQMQRYGNVQRNFHVLSRPLVPTATAPLCMDLTDFTCQRTVSTTPLVINNGALTYQVLPAGAGVANASTWDNNSTYINNNPYWAFKQKDAPDGGQYLAMNATYSISVSGVPNLDNTRIRFDIIAEKPGTYSLRQLSTLQSTGVHLPNSLVYMQNLVGGIQNRISKDHFKHYYTKTIFINSSKVDADTKGTTSNVQQFTIRIKPNKVMRQQTTAPKITPGEDTGISNGDFGPNNVATTQPLWLIISTDDQVATASDQVRVEISRTCTWRDYVGSAPM